MGSIFSFIIVISASIIGGYFIHEMFQYVSFFGLTQKQQIVKAIEAAQRKKNAMKDSHFESLNAVTNPEIKD
ncbi:hypothetical protein KIH23_05040 [Flavobacterium sp. CYK-55]|uniref:hypothetical protein n=1 Tax=Flavobacterium sp. CYK-55 TaxID=2835529 RepID=UPI001BCDE89F|nr:hypothetical protein [Flavobacterium sp. CYK-55]MBS7786653.1 hypothetical protein [Flavobacterium sp. CYK-55]